MPREYHQHQHLQENRTIQEQPKEGPQKCPVYLRLPWIGNVSLKFEKQTKSAIKECYSAVQPRIIFSIGGGERGAEGICPPLKRFSGRFEIIRVLSFGKDLFLEKIFNY